MAFSPGLRQFPISSIKGEVKKKHFRPDWKSSCFPARLIERDIRDAAAVAKATKSAELVLYRAAPVGNELSIDNQVNAIGTRHVETLTRRET
jgi:hypothetical protein